MPWQINRIRLLGVILLFGAALSGVVFLGEPFGAMSLPASVMIILGVWACRNKRA